jgi:hypothetical protein
VKAVRGASCDWPALRRRRAGHGSDFSELRTTSYCCTFFPRGKDLEPMIPIVLEMSDERADAEVADRSDP